MNKKLNNVNIDEDHLVGIKFVDKLMRRHSELADLVTNSSVEPVRVDKVTDEVYNALFAKVDVYTKVLVPMGVIEPCLQSFGDIEASRKYNADEVVLNTIKRKQEKCVGLKKKKKKNGRRDIKKGTQPPNCLKTPEEDKKMNKHVSLMICSQAD
eukprot:9026591-Ditylum_brightwellii.AAC.1